MNAAEILAALDLPAGAVVDRRVSKTLLVENGAPTAADKRRINDGIEEFYWLAALKPTTIGVPEYRNDVREYLEISVLRLALRIGAKASRLVELVHRAVPYPVLLLTEQGERVGLSLAHKRWSQGESGKTVIDGGVVAVEWGIARDGRHAAAFSDALALVRQPRGTLYALYDGWIDTLLALEAARRTGIWKIPDSNEHALARREALRECVRLEGEIIRLRTAGTKEKQLPRRVELNLALKRVETAQAAALAKL